MSHNDDAREAEERRKALQEEREERHAQWKRIFFLARPPPKPRDQLRRGPHERIGPIPAHKVMKRAREIAAANYAREAEMPSAKVARVSDTAVVGDARQQDWLAKMMEERDSRRPLADPHAKSNPKCTVIMARLHRETSEAELREFANQFGRVVSVRLVRHPRTGRSLCYAFVEFGLQGEARKAVQWSEKRRLRGRAVVIDTERGRTDPMFVPARMATATKIQQQLAHEDVKSEAEASLLSGAVDDEEAFLNSMLDIV